MRPAAPAAAWLAMATIGSAAAQAPSPAAAPAASFAIAAPLVAPLPGSLPAPLPPAGPWVVSETHSPVDFAPIAAATTTADADEALRLSIQCRGGQVEVLFLLPLPATGREAASVTARVGADAAAALPLRVAPSPLHPGLSLREDGRRFLAGLPAEGTLRLRVAVPGQPDVEGSFALSPLATVLRRLARSCTGPGGG